MELEWGVSHFLVWIIIETRTFNITQLKTIGQCLKLTCYKTRNTCLICLRCAKNHFHARVKANRKHSVGDIKLQALFHCAYTCMCSRRKVHFFTFPFPYTIFKESALSRLFCLLESALSHHAQNKQQPPLVDSFLLVIILQNVITIISYLTIP